MKLAKYRVQLSTEKKYSSKYEYKYKYEYSIPDCYGKQKRLRIMLKKKQRYSGKLYTVTSDYMKLHYKPCYEIYECLD